MVFDEDILIVDDDPTVIALLGKILRSIANIRFATSGSKALQLIQERLPDLILMDVEMPEMTGFEVCEQLKRELSTRDIPVILNTSHDSEEQEVKGFAAGAVDFISKPPREAIVLARVKTQLKLKKIADVLRQTAVTDGMTGIANRRLFDDKLPVEWKRCLRDGRPISILLIDIDHFKSFNDQYGHRAGDECIVRVAQTIAKTSRRPADVIARYGGEEIVVLLPDTDSRGAIVVADAIQEGIKLLAISHSQSEVSDTVTVSIGISSFDRESRYWIDSPSINRDRENVEQPIQSANLLEAADQALYVAKRSGRKSSWFLSVDHQDIPDKASKVNK